MYCYMLLKLHFVSLSNVTLLIIIFILFNFHKFIIRLHYLYLFFIFAKFQGIQILITTSL